MTRPHESQVSTAIDVATIRFFQRLGLPILQGYGLTECSPVVTACTERHARLGSVGRPLRGVEVEIREEAPGSGEGEVVMRGANRMKGYYRRDDLTRGMIDSDGWLHTGDRGRIDADGYLFITGRIKNLIVLGSGLYLWWVRRRAPRATLRDEVAA